MSITVLLDENVSPEIADFILRVRPDEDFADTRMYPAGSHAGVIRLRVWPTTIEETQRAPGRLFETTSDDLIPESLIIIDNAQTRIRRAARHN